jgi:hypothetical protein
MVHRLRGTLENLIDDERRSLRPIGMSVREAASRTEKLLDRLTENRGVQLFAGVRVAKGAPRIGFAVSTATHLLLLESVAWPAGEYTVGPHGRVLCDGTYIGQSVLPLIGSVRLLRRVVRRRRIGAVVVVHPSGAGAPSLPVSSPAGPAWLAPDKVGSHIARRLLLRRSETSYCHGDTNSWYSLTYRQ